MELLTPQEGRYDQGHGFVPCVVRFNLRCDLRIIFLLTLDPRSVAGPAISLRRSFDACQPLFFEKDGTLGLYAAISQSSDEEKNVADVLFPRGTR